jgi:ABC-type multidrug transport system fused ATPase/permease subunit
MSIFLLLFGLIFALAGGVVLWDYITVVTSYESLPGKVIAFRTQYKRSGSTSYLYYPVIEYIAYGNKKKFQANSGASWPMYDIGESVEVYYSKEYDDSRLKSIAQAVIGPVFLIIGLGVCYMFWMNFEMTFFSLITAFGMSGAIAWFFGKLLRKKDIKSVPELSQKVRSFNKKVRHKNELEAYNLITEQSELLSSDQPGNKNSKFVGPIFTLVGLVAIGVAIYLGIDRWNFLGRAEMSEGTVLEYKRHSDEDGTTYYPIVEYKSPNTSQTITFQHDVGSSNRSYRIGAEVPVLYDPENIRDAIIDEGLWNWFGPIIIGVLGLSFFFVGGTLTQRWLKVERFKNKSLSY